MVLTQFKLNAWCSVVGSKLKVRVETWLNSILISDFYDFVKKSWEQLWKPLWYEKRSLFFIIIIVIFSLDLLLKASQFMDIFILIYQIFSGGRENGEQRSQT